MALHGNIYYMNKIDIKSGIYKIFWNNNPYFYYGQAVNLTKRKNSHFGTMRLGKHKNPKIQNIFNKYGLPSFEIIEKCELSLLDQKEQIYIDMHFNNSFCCNINPLATSSKGVKHSAETIEKNRLSHLKICEKEKNPFYGKKHTLETRKKISDSKKNKKFPKISQSKKGTIASSETRKKMSERRKYDGCWKAKPVIDINTGVFYVCIKEVSDLYNISGSTLRSYLNGNRINKTQWRIA